LDYYPRLTWQVIQELHDAKVSARNGGSSFQADLAAVARGSSFRQPHMDLK
jgi:hypothetical protein